MAKVVQNKSGKKPLYAFCFVKEKKEKEIIVLDKKNNNKHHQC